MMQCNALTNFNPLQESEQLSQLNAAYEIAYSLERMYKNILLINAGVNAKQINVNNTTLFQVAVQEYDDATLWTYIAQVNGLIDFEIASPITLNIPPKPPATAGFGT